jgi:inner membrane protein
MPTPLAHGVAGSAVARTVKNGWRSWRFVAIAFVLASVPDLDFIPGVLAGDAGGFHRRATHSLFAAVVFTVPIALLLWRYAGKLLGKDAFRSDRRPGFLAWYAFVVPVYLSHLLLDLVSLDQVDNSGLQLWWPFSNRYATAPLPVPESLRGFFDLKFGPTAHDFFRTFFSGHALAVYFIEALLVSPLLLLPWAVSRWRNAHRRAARVDEQATTSGPGSTPAKQGAGSRRNRRPVETSA